MNGWAKSQNAIFKHIHKQRQGDKRLCDVGKREAGKVKVRGTGGHNPIREDGRESECEKRMKEREKVIPLLC